MAERSPENAPKPERPTDRSIPSHEPMRREGWGRWILSLGLAAVISGAFGLTTEMVGQREARLKQQCEIATQLLTDETPSPALAPADRDKLLAKAARRADICIEDEQ